MQIKDKHLNYLRNPWLIGSAKVVLFLASLFFIFDSLSGRWKSVGEIILPADAYQVILLVSILMIFNWLLEALRWQVSLLPLEDITFLQALRDILRGLSMNWVLPFTTGDLAGRLSGKSNKYEATSALVLNRSIMLSFTLCMGAYAFGQRLDLVNWIQMAIWMFAFVLVLVIFKRWSRRFVPYFRKLSSGLWMSIIGISLLRYLLFVFQFYIILRVFLPDLDASLLLGGVGWIFFVRSMLPLFFGGIGLREASGVLFFQPYVADLALVIVPIFLIWLINTVVPSILGVFFIFRLRRS